LLIAGKQGTNLLEVEEYSNSRGIKFDFIKKTEQSELIFKVFLAFLLKNQLKESQITVFIWQSFTLSLNLALCIFWVEN